MRKVNKAVWFSRVVEKLQMIIGSVFLIVWGLFGVISLTEPETRILLVIFIPGFLIGLFLLILSLKRRRLNHAFLNYRTLLYADPQIRISELAAQLGKEERLVWANLQQMVTKKFFGHAYLDGKEGRLICLSPDTLDITAGLAKRADRVSAPQTGGVKAAGAFPAEPENMEYVTVICSRCGGVNKVVKGKVGECEYCRLPLSE